MEYYYNVPPRFSRPRARHASFADGYFHHYYRTVYSPIGHDNAGVAHGVNYGFFLPIAAGVDYVWLAPMIPRRNFSHRRVRTYLDHVDSTLIFNDDESAIRQTRRRRRAPFEIPPRLQGGVREDETWVLISREQYPQDLPWDGASNMQGPSVADNGSTTERVVSKFLEARTSSEITTMSGDDVEICIVCQDDLGTDRVATLDCRHRYHLECIKTWLTLKNFCPICKATALSVADS